MAPLPTPNRGELASTSSRQQPQQLHGAARLPALSPVPDMCQRQHRSRKRSCAALARAPRPNRLARELHAPAPARSPPHSGHQPAHTHTTPPSLLSRLNWELLLAFAALGPAGPALADEGLRYNAERGEGLVKTMSGVAYIGLLLYFLTRVLNRRARKAREERLAGQGPVTTVFTELIEKVTAGKEKPKLTPLSTLIGAAQAGVIAWGLFIFTSKVEAAISVQDLPSGYTAANIAITVRTIIIGLLYLATFIFGANAAGLTGLSIQLLLFPGSVPDEPDAPRVRKEPELPRVTVTSSREDIRRAFDVVSRGATPGGSAASSGAATPAQAPAAAADGSSGDGGASSAPGMAASSSSSASSSPTSTL